MLLSRRKETLLIRVFNVDGNVVTKEMESGLKNEMPQKTSEEELLELAKKELLRDIKCASLRAEQYGAHSWAKPQHYAPSKRFLKHMLISASKDNDRREQQTLESRERAIKHINSSHKHSEDVRKRNRDNYIENETKNSKKHKNCHGVNKESFLNNEKKSLSKNRKKDKKEKYSVKRKHSER
ncbi:uncharacterized protein CDAR_3021 [Caerostris darwini]|uniref:Uncharacterized protein n=1 Tax=Caerostris darwini TaxID=1538125 RepID=A0AAV4UUU7_9ARAC|nr:uncharacterized protein CDAR_3021 [Caerostris darwini]